MTTRLLLVLLGVCSNLLFAGNDRGHGGGVVVCRDANKNVKSIELLDYYENRKLRDIEPELGDASLSYYTKIEIILARIEKLDPVRARRYRTKVMDFASKTKFTEGVILPNTNDFGHVPLANGCEIEQLASQRDVRLPEDKNYLINKDLWEHPLLSEASRAGLILHEIVYYDALQLGHQNSIYSRYYVALMSSKRAEFMDKAYYADLMERINLVDLDCSNPNFYPGLNSGVSNINPLKWKKNNRVVFELTSEDPFLRDSVGHAYLTFEYENESEKSVTLHVSRQVSELTGNGVNLGDNYYLTYDKNKPGAAPVVSDPKGAVVTIGKPKPNFSECLLIQNREEEVLGRPVIFSRLKGKISDSEETHEFSSWRSTNPNELVKSYEIRHDRYSSTESGELKVQTNALKVISIK